MSDNSNPNGPRIPGEVKTVGDMITALGTHIDDVLTGKLDEKTARQVFTGRKLQLKSAELQLQYARLYRGRRPDPVMPLIPAASEATSNLSSEEAAELERLQKKAQGLPK